MELSPLALCKNLPGFSAKTFTKWVLKVVILEVIIAINYCQSVSPVADIPRPNRLAGLIFVIEVQDHAM
jgi:hypothetical protein